MSFFSRFRRITSTGKYLPFIDGLRFIAITPVVLSHIFHLIMVKKNIPQSHINSFLWNPVNNGGQGVQIFFAISGFILAIPFISYHLGISQKSISIKGYFLRRLTRLEPPYIISMLFFFMVLIVTHKNAFSELFPHLIASLFYVHNIIYGKGSDINTVAWSLEVEIQFYILAPLIFLIFKSNQLLRRSVIVLFIITFAFLNAYFDIYYRTLLGQFQFFLIGVLAADIYLTQKDTNIIKQLNRPLIFVFCLSILLFINYRDSFFSQLLFLFDLLVLFLCSISSNLKNKFLKSDIITFTGGMCYSIYLIHYPLISLIGNKIITKIYFNNIVLDFIISSLIIVPVIFFTSVGFYILFERPFMDKEWYKKIFVFKNKKRKLNF
ncbi:acyltransferase family protein [Mucilaginibacter sp. OK098]|uniref:acyltransferase family protein n=1 Tax=Mucilaginibacter sp. OK098 TaxID=1855297 RepID=UPI000921D750|nr:acyltransferase [Mucilaginibacter sp. OK098]SHL93326.1 Peptidoglycan/LPS O-acetylase OafA/YrhL, contains acyltransferase and SGNH-hydrolase domains [Mucilaginibacter sp. OK098]